jgi:hypothetical protein
MGHYDDSRPGYCARCGAAPGNIKNGRCAFCVFPEPKRSPPMPTLNVPVESAAPLETVRAMAEELVRAADELGIVVTIEQEPLAPLAMRNYKTVVHVRTKLVQQGD